MENGIQNRLAANPFLEGFFDPFPSQDQLPQIAYLKNVINGPRWAHFDTFLRDQCFLLGLNSIHIERETSLLREAVRYEISGPTALMIKLNSSINSAIAEYND